MHRRNALKAIGASVVGSGIAGAASAASPPVKTMVGSANRPLRPGRLRNVIRDFVAEQEDRLRKPAIGKNGFVIPRLNTGADEDIVGFGVGADPRGTLRVFSVTTGDIEQTQEAQKDVDRQTGQIPDLEQMTRDRLSTFETTTTDVTTQDCGGVRRFKQVEIEDWSCPFVESGRLQYGNKDKEGTHEVWDQVYNDGADNDLIGTTTNYQQTPGQNYDADSSWVCWDTNTRHGYDDRTYFGEPINVFTAPDSTSSEGQITGADASVGPLSFGVGFSWNNPPIVINDQHTDQQAQWLVTINDQFDTQRERGFASIANFDGASPGYGDTVVRIEADADFTNGPIVKETHTTFGTVNTFRHDEYYDYY